MRRLGGHVLDLSGGRLLDPVGRTVALRPQSFAVLCHLAKNAGRLVTKDELMAAVWPRIAVTDDSLVQCIGDIRRALGEDGKALLQTVPRQGYRLATTGVGDRRRRWVWGGALAAGLAAVVVAAGIGWFRPPPANDGPPRIAVMPFATFGGDETAYLGDGVAEDVISMLARSPDVVVIARGSSFAFGDEPRDAREIGAALGVDYLLEGSVRREGPNLRIGAQLESTATGEHLWAERFERVGPDPWALVDEVSARIINALAGEEGELRRAQFREAWGKDSARLGEYDYFLRGLDVFMNAERAEDNERAGAIWRQGLARYPDSAILKVKVGWYHWQAAWNFWSGDFAEHFSETHRLVTEVLATDNLSPEVLRVGHWLNAMVQMQRGAFDASVAEAERAVAMAPYDAWMRRGLTEVLVAAGRYQQALDWLDIAEPGEPGREEAYATSRATIYRFLGRYEESDAIFATVEPDDFYYLMSWAITLVHLDRLEEARALAARALEEMPGFTRTMWRENSFYADPAVLDDEIASLAALGVAEN